MSLEKKKKAGNTAQKSPTKRKHKQITCRKDIKIHSAQKQNKPGIKCAVPLNKHTSKTTWKDKQVLWDGWSHHCSTILVQFHHHHFHSSRRPVSSTKIVLPSRQFFFEATLCIDCVSSLKFRSATPVEKSVRCKVTWGRHEWQSIKDRHKRGTDDSVEAKLCNAALYYYDATKVHLHYYLVTRMNFEVFLTSVHTALGTM